MPLQRINIERVVLLVQVLVGDVGVRSGMGFSCRRRLRGIGSDGLGFCRGSGGGEGGDLRSLAAKVVGEEEEGEDAADDDGEQGDGDCGKIKKC